MEENVNLDLLKAALDGSVSCVKDALKAGADVNFALPQWEDPMIDHDETGPFTVLYAAALKAPKAILNALIRHVDVVKLLLRKGASLVMRSTGHGFSPLHIAAMKGYTEVVEVLVRHGATVDIKETHWMTPIICACVQGHVDTVRRLIKFGARVDLVFGGKHYHIKTFDEIKTCDKDKYPKRAECFRLAQEALETKLLRCCNTKCNKPGYRSDLKLCAGCKLTRYCSRECQRQHWSGGHKNCCGLDDVYWGCGLDDVYWG